ncbi:MAG: FtsW/RodA/SpoVE family cell cycle protein [Patescibacteria group bacterium]|nr:FtsW/RodA/SpoVE family cell cycle protein [Patescibacteria group bacterium]
MIFFKKIDWKLNSAVLFLVFMGLLELFSAHEKLFWKQLIWFGIGTVFYFIFIAIDWRSFVNYKGVTVGFYLISVIFLVATLILAPKVRGARSWIPIGPLQFQTSVFSAMTLIITLANFFRKMHAKIAYFSSLVYSFIYFIIPAGLIALQPDFGSILILFSIWLGFVLVSGISKKHLLFLIMIFSIVGAMMWHGILKDYQKERIAGLFFPDRDVLGVNYNVIQAKIAIGSGGFFGKGFKQGTQTQLGFLPESQTDFIFAAIIEEWGLISAFFIVAALAFIIMRLVKIGMGENGNFNRFICLGASIFFITCFIFNTGSNIGFIPVIGIPFPFLSYGGSHLIIEMMLLGMIQSVKIRKF